ncbi:MAG: hypothetical protein DRP87_19165 [Spirochaetes bacterium]|nr:MAG: hypothetical protein DRP87_19165 [Spirochaetota bacterium]
MDWIRKCGDKHILEAFPYHWDLVGQNPPEIVLGKGSGLPSVGEKLEKMGIKGLDEKTEEKILLEVKEKSLAKKGLLDSEEFEQIVKKCINK